jgi:pimeloyl-ACP methyl ester carboxylesterase
VAQLQAFCQHIPHPEFCIIEDSGHMVAMEQPEVFTAILQNWLAQYS